MGAQTIRRWWFAVALAMGLGCSGAIRSGGGAEPTAGASGAGLDPGPTGGGTRSLDALALGPSGMRRLTRIEYDNTIRDLLGDDARAGFAALPEDVADPFDNDYRTQIVSKTLIESAETLASEAAARLIADPARRASVVGCAPKAPDDAECLRGFVTRFGRRAFRRPLTDEEITGFVALRSFGREANDFWAAVALVVRAMLQDPSFLYLVEVGRPVPGTPGLVQLTDHEIASRLAYVLLGSTPPDALLDAADRGQLSTSDGRRAVATTLLGDARGRARLQQFHAFWLGYHQLPFAPELANALRAESDALVAKVVFDDPGDYLRLFRSSETFLTATLAAHYGLPAPSSARGGFVPYGASPRRGILSHGAVLAAGAKFDDTSPTLRGVFVRNRLLCTDVPPPPPNVNADMPPSAAPASRCKRDRYVMHTQGGCASCHDTIDPIGFGLENFDREGRYRATDKDAPECAIDGKGTASGLGDFVGPAGLADLLTAGPGAEGFDRCVVTQLHRFAFGRRAGDADEPLLTTLTARFRQGHAFDGLLLDVVASAAFAHRRLEDQP